MTTGRKMEIGKVYFEEGVPGFPRLQFFHIVQEDSEIPFLQLLSMEDEKVGFWIIDPFLFFDNYEFVLKDPIKQALHITDQSSVTIFTIVTPRENGITVNLKAPIVVNLDNRMAKQIILDEDYEVRAPLSRKENPPGGR